MPRWNRSKGTFPAIPWSRMPRTLIIVGAGGHGKVLVDLVEQLPDWHLSGLLDDTPAKQSADIFGFPVVGGTDRLRATVAERGVDAAAIAFGDNATRRRFFEIVRQAGIEAATLVHPSAVISPHARLGAGVVVLAGVVVNAGALVGDNVCLNTGCSIDHDCRIEDHVHVSPNATLTGGVWARSGATIGANAVVNPNLKIGRDAVVGSGAVVVRDVEQGQVVAGNPARPLRGRSARAGSRGEAD